MSIRSSRNESGVALVTTIIVVAVLAVVAVAFMQSTSTDRLSSRTVANYYRAQLAAKAGLAEAMALIQQGAQSFAYVSGAEPQGEGYRTFLRSVSGDSGTWEFNGEKLYLDSGLAEGEGARLLLTGSLDEPRLSRTAAWKGIPIENARPNETNRYAFWVDDSAGKQNLTWWGGGGERGVVTNLADIRLALPSPDGAESGPFPAAALTALGELRAYVPSSFQLANLRFNSVRASVNLPSVSSLNLVAPGVLGESMERYFFTMASASGATTPAGAAKLNFASLRRHINNLNSDQGPGSPRALLVEELLKEEPLDEESWGGGSLSWLAKSEKYTPEEQKQIVANIIDYLDDDLIPTTDNVDNPGYFGVEAKVDSSGGVIGHPMVNFLTVGLIFNRSTLPGPNQWKINSTRVLCSVGVTYPWSSQNTSTAAYEPEITIRVEGNVSDGLPALGAQAGPYFLPQLGEQLTSRPSPTFERFSGSNFPQAVGIAGSASYATRFFGHSAGDWPERLPASVQFNDVKLKIEKFRLKYTPTDGRSPGYVFVLPKDQVIELDPPTVSPGGPGPGSFFVKITEATYKNSKNLYLNADPRSHFRAGSWTKLASKTPFGTQIPEPADGPDAVEIDSGSDTASGDGPQGVAMDFTWFKGSSVTNHFNRLSREGMESIGELGYIWTGKPWQTVNLTEVNNASPQDWNLLDYITAGRKSGDFEVPVLPVKAASTNNPAAALKGSLLSSGGFNVNTRKQATITAVMSNAPDIEEGFAAAVLAEPSGSRASAYGEIAALAAAAPNAVSGGASTKFARESVQRALANVAVNHSRIFTVHAAGEYRLGDAVSRAQLEADVFVGVDPATGSAMIQVIDQRFR